MKIIYQEDSFTLDSERISDEKHPIFGDMTVFHGVVIASEIVQPYQDGNAYKPRDELEKYTPYVDGRWVIVGGHPQDGIISERDQVSGRTVNPRYVKDLIDPKSKRPNRAGVRSDVQIFNDKVAPKMLKDMKNGLKNDVSIGFFFSKDATSGIVDDGPFKGSAYDYIQRNMFHDHLAAGIDEGRCPSPYCGLGADEIGRRIGNDPFGGFANFGECTEKIMKEQGVSKESASKICGSLKAKHEDNKLEDESLKNDLVKVLIGQLLDELREVKAMKDAKNDKQPEWYLNINWREEPYQTMFDSLNDETRQHITDEGLCPHCGEDEECPEGEEWNGEHGKCMPSKTNTESDVEESNPGFKTGDPTAEEECSEGMEWNAEQMKCVEIADFSKRPENKKVDLDPRKVLERYADLKHRS